MNKISQQILNFIRENDEWINKVLGIRSRFNNQKDFTNQVGYVIMDIVSREKKFFDINRSDIDVNGIAQELF